MCSGITEKNIPAVIPVWLIWPGFTAFISPLKSFDYSEYACSGRNLNGVHIFSASKDRDGLDAVVTIRLHETDGVEDIRNGFPSAIHGRRAVLSSPTMTTWATLILIDVSVAIYMKMKLSVSASNSKSFSVLLNFIIAKQKA
ncbi:uncharacterized protein LOC105430303 [Pogonomyrmex barbatus]|uniref:Uncharacterized protein LOC105430303 n=1 Tax=Pogonomyrmex barbatus TaxID=144034 RepID=A0A8N1S9R6_9HYME|nr:uncharacterized protein LOC105430303 [Pogonomyrmex barbatus]